ncbi:unnamed protein product [Rotaria socialis]|uniref:Uncharacterized protein n=2 Tax=Rotaria socialis TaxID=392032 RepID=A0A820DXY7_9BILA|nr:unnamed protein product [Rotaria socialis]CAF3650738.1 unnamed protein product [Rotaria socialis]CAF4239876.1 unnamed protein product [Rotaria socialis]CAF4446009.1 unnamed protein product [Rotaria socialis]
MTELIEIRQLKPVKERRSHARSYAFTAANASSDSSEDESSSNDETPFVFNSKSSKTSKRKNIIQSLPVILNTQSVEKQKKKHHKYIQQFLINTQPPTPKPKRKEIVIKQIMEPSLMSGIQYVPMPSSRPMQPTIIERKPLVYERVYTPTLVDEYSNYFYSFYESPFRRGRLMRPHPSNTKNVRLPKHSKTLVNRFLSGIEHAHAGRYADESDSDCSINDCKVCRRLRSAMNEGKRRSNSEVNIYRGSQIVFDTEEPYRHKHAHSKNCKICDLLEESDFIISTKTDRSRKPGKHVHMVESFPSNIKPTVETTTTTTTTATQPKSLANDRLPTISSVPMQPAYYPMPYTTYVDPNTGLTYAYDPSGTGFNYDYSSHYNNPAYIQSNSQYDMYNNIVPPVTVATNPTIQQQEQIQTTTTVNPNLLADKGTLTYMPSDRKKHKRTNKTVVVHTSRNPTPPAPKIIIEQPHRSRLPRKIQ